MAMQTAGANCSGTKINQKYYNLTETSGHTISMMLIDSKLTCERMKAHMPAA